jgi:uncharacterized protein (TIGR03437 family)
LYLSSSQINFVVPDLTALGSILFSIQTQTGGVIWQTASAASVEPGIFAENGNGNGVAAAEAVRIAANNAQTALTVFNCPAIGNCVAVPIDLGLPTDRVALVLYGTGIRGRSSLNGVVCTVGGIGAQVLYAGAQTQYPGLDQVNILLPTALIGAGAVDVKVVVDGKSANVVNIQIK